MRVCLWLTLFLLASVNAYAAPVRFGSFLIDDEDGQTIILAGPILRSAPLDLRRALKAFPGVRTMALHSEGGDVTAGLLVAQEVFDLGLDTRIVVSPAGCMTPVHAALANTVAMLSRMTRRAQGSKRMSS